MAATIVYYIDQNGNYYINSNNDYYIASETYDSAPTKLYYLKYRPCIHNEGKFKKYTAYIRQSDGSYLKLKPYVYTKIEVAIAGMAIPGVSRASSNE